MNIKKAGQVTERPLAVRRKIMDFLGIGIVVVVTVVGSLVFWALLQNSIIINPSLMGLFSWWLSCLVGTAVALYLVADIFLGMVSWAIDFVKQYYMYMIGAVVVIGGLAMLGNKNAPEKELNKEEKES
jgi:hypothetical protein